MERMVRIGHTLNEEEKKHVTGRRVTVQQCLAKHNIPCRKDSVPNIALIGSGGGERAMVGLLGSVLQLGKHNLLDCMMYLSGVSGSTWGMASLYKHANWSSKVEPVTKETVKRLGGGPVSWGDCWTKWRKYRNQWDNNNNTELWAAYTVTTFVKEIDEHVLSEQRGKHDMDPYPIYTVIDEEVKERKELWHKDTWVEMTPHEAGYSLTGAFVDQRYFGSKFDSGEFKKEQPEMDMLYVQGMCGSALAGSSPSYEVWTVIEEVVKREFQDGCLACQVLQSLVKLNLVENSEYGPVANRLNKLLEGKVDKFGIPFFFDAQMMQAFDKSIQMDMLKRYTLSVNEYFPDWNKDCTIDPEMWTFMMVTIKAIYWWGTTYNHLYNMQVEEVDRAILGSETRNYIDAGLLLNSPYFSVLRKERNIDLIISLDFSEGDPMMTIEDAHVMSNAMGIAFPRVTFPEDDRKNPKDFYVFPGDGKRFPTVIHMPLFNKVNCGADIDEWRQRYKTKRWTFDQAYSPEMISDLLGKAGENVVNNKDRLLEEIRKIVERKTFTRNLLKNPSGEEQLESWELTANGGSQWKVEDLPNDHEFPNDGVTKYFATTSKLCLKRQVIDLLAEGYSPKDLDAQPAVNVEDWYSGRTDCGCVYDVIVRLLDGNQKVLQEFKPDRVKLDPESDDGSWKQVSHRFTEYGPGLRFISFEHGGQDTKGWNGWYGVRVTGSVVTLQPVMARNLLKNPSGEELLESWELTANGGNQRTVQNLPGDGGHEFPNDGVTRYFATSSKEHQKKAYQTDLGGQMDSLPRSLATMCPCGLGMSTSACGHCPNCIKVKEDSLEEEKRIRMDLEEDLKRSQKTILDLENENEKLKDEITLLLNKIEDAQSSVYLQKTIKEKQAAIKALEEEMEAEGAARAEVEKKRDELSRDLQGSETLNTKLKEDLERSQESILDLEKDKQQSDLKIKDMQASLEEEKKIHMDLEEDLKRSQKTILDLEKDKQQSDQKIKDMQKIILDLENDKQQSDQKIKDMQASLEEEKKIHMDLEEDLKRSQKTILDLEKDKQQSDQKIKDMQKIILDLENDKQESDQKIKDMQAAIKALEEEKEAERAARAEVEKKRDELSRDLQGAETLNTKLEEDLERSQESILDLQKDKQQSDLKIKDMKAAIKALEEEKEAERAARAELEKKRDELSRDLQRAETLNTKLEEDLKRSQESILDLEKDKQQSDLKIKDMQAHLKAELRRIQQYAVDVTLDPDTSHRKLILSEDGKQVSHGDIWKDLPDNKERFDQCICVLGKQSFSSGRFYYEVQVKGKTEWTVGVARESINRKGSITLNPNNGYWTILLRNGNEYKASADPTVLLTVREEVQKVGVFVDYEEGLVSFYGVEARVHLYSFTGCSFTEKLYPFFSPCFNYGGTNSAPLIISAVSMA